jgi:hypothetical protein
LGAHGVPGPGTRDRLRFRRGGPCARLPPVVVNCPLSREGQAPPLRREGHDQGPAVIFGFVGAGLAPARLSS